MRMILSRNGAATPTEPHPEMIRQCQKLQEEARPGSGPKLPWELLSKDRSAQAASSTTNTRTTQAPAETRAVETGPGREMLSTVEKPG